MRRMGTLEKEISNNITSPCYKFSFTKELVATNQDNCAFGKEKCPDFLGFIDSGSVFSIATVTSYTNIQFWSSEV